ncbi:MAG: ABC transporter permease [Planctomycetes bacterium]|nr:ABC transporter permease [Planctomycetota bacterium]
MNVLLLRSGLRHLLRHPGQVGLSLLGIALGVAVVLAVDVASGSARRAFQLSSEAVAGRATHRIEGGPSGLAEEVYTRLRVQLGVRAAAPVVEGWFAASQEPGRALRLLGVDPFAEAPFRPYLARGRGGVVRERGDLLGPLLTRPGAALLAEQTARRLGAVPGEPLHGRAAGRTVALVPVGTFAPDTGAPAAALETIVLMDIASAQELLGMAGRLSHVDLILPDGPAGAERTARIRAELPPGVRLVPAGARAEGLARMTEAFHVNLGALSLLALVVGMFLIYNAMTFSVVQRHAVLGCLRAIGVTRGQLLRLILGEAALLGIAGTGLGTLAGIGLAHGLVDLVSRTINDLYYAVEVRSLHVEALQVVKAAGLGFAATLGAAFLPAYEAGGAPPRAVLHRSRAEARVHRALPRLSGLGLLLLALGGTLMLATERDLIVSYAGLFAGILGFALLVPALLVLVLRAVDPLARRAGVLPRMALRSLATTLSRSAVAVAALTVAVAAAVGIGTMVGSFRATVVVWLEQVLGADVYVAPARSAARVVDAVLSPALVERLRGVDGLSGLSTYRTVRLDVGGEPVQLVAMDLDPRIQRTFRFRDGTPGDVWQRLAEGALLVSEPFRFRTGLGIGASVAIPTDTGVRAFPVAGVFDDYATDQGILMMHRREYERHFADRGISSVSLLAAPGVTPGELVQRVGRLPTLGQEVHLSSNAVLRQRSLEVFDRTFTITRVLYLLTTGVAFVGVLSALLALQLERTREFGVLRALGLTQGQLGRMVALQSAGMGLVAGVLAQPLGAGLAAALLFVINRRSFGWVLQMEWSWAVAAQGVGVAAGAALLAGVLPALRLARMPPAEALREE